MTCMFRSNFFPSKKFLENSPGDNPLNAQKVINCRPKLKGNRTPTKKVIASLIVLHTQRTPVNIPMGKVCGKVCCSALNLS